MLRMIRLFKIYGLACLLVVSILSAHAQVVPYHLDNTALYDFLDELANTSPMVQEKLLRVIEYGEYERVGGNKTLKCDVRLVAATNEDLPALADEGKFRHDLLDRLAFDVLTLPPLRERERDILLLAESFAVSMASELGREYFPGFSGEARKQLLHYEWPGNVRELKNVVERCVYRHDSTAEVDTILFDPFDSPFRPGASLSSGAPIAGTYDKADFPIDLKQSVQDYEIDLINQAMETAKFNQRKAAELLEVTYHQLRGYLKKYELLNKE